MLAPNNKVLLTLDKLYTDEILLSGGLKLYLDPSWKPEWNVTVSGTVAALPAKGLQGLEIGDKVYFSYHVVNEVKHEDDLKFFVRNKTGNEYVREYTDKLGSTIKVVAFQGPITKRWAGTYVNERGEFIDGFQGDEAGVDNWLATNFKFGYSQSKIYKNCIEIDGADYWLASEDLLYAVKKNGEFKAMPGYAICRPIAQDITTRINLAEGLSLPPMSIVVKPQDRGIVIAIGEGNSGAQVGDTVLFEPKYVEKYQFDGEDLFVVKHRRLLSKI